MGNYYHWSDVQADQIIRSRGDKKKYIIQSGITPSGMIHAGNFREVITADLIRRALEKRGKEVEFLYIWDDYDVLRKVPVNLPKPEMIKENLRKPVFVVPDPYGCHESYAQHFEKVFEKENEHVGITASFRYSHQYYLDCAYAEEIKTALEKTQEIKEILNQYRKEPLHDQWLPILLFCAKCQKDTTTLRWTKGYEVDYTCECGNKATVDFRKEGIVTLRWRIDWPMRWHHNTVDFESAGKDHFAAGGSVDTARKIQTAVYGSQYPYGFCYEWIGIKGKGEFASSTGNVVTITQMLKVFEPEIIRYIFADTRPNRAFQLSFDTDVLKLYEDYDQVERIYFGEEKTNEKKTEKAKVAYELSQIQTIPKKIPYQPGFRHLTLLLQIHSFDIPAVTEYFAKQLTNPRDKERLMSRAQRAAYWVQHYAPEDFRFTVQKTAQITLSKQEKAIAHEIAQRLDEKEWTDSALHEEFYIIANKHEIPPQDFFRLCYQILINQEKGPKLASFILTVGKERVRTLFSSV